MKSLSLFFVLSNLFLINVQSNYSQSPNAPTNFLATQITGTQIHLEWNDNSNNETGFFIQKKVQFIHWISKANADSNSTSIDITENPGEFCEYRICAYNDSGLSGFAYSNFIYNQGLQLFLNSLIEGYWEGTYQINSTVLAKIRNTFSPYQAIDSAIVNSNFGQMVAFVNSPSGNYNLSLQGKNCIETWSAIPITLDVNFIASYSFIDSQASAYGNNLKTINSFWFIYSGDVNQDGSVDLTDCTMIDNDAFNFTTGNVVTDLNGDFFVDIVDATMADNNAFNYVCIIRP